MTGNSVKSTDRVTDPAKLDLITATQAGDNERYQLEVSRSFICRCPNMCVNLNLLMPQLSGYGDMYAPF